MITARPASSIPVTSRSCVPWRRGLIRRRVGPFPWAAARSPMHTSCAAKLPWCATSSLRRAKRAMKPGTTRLVLIDAGHLACGRARPTLGEFALAPGMEDFSAAEQVESYAEAFGQAPCSAARRARLIARQLEALRWLELLIAEEPKAGDAVAAWLAPMLVALIDPASTGSARAGGPACRALTLARPSASCSGCGGIRDRLAC